MDDEKNDLTFQDAYEVEDDESNEDDKLFKEAVHNLFGEPKDFGYEDDESDEVEDEDDDIDSFLEKRGVLSRFEDDEDEDDDEEDW